MLSDWHIAPYAATVAFPSLNAPSGAQCFPTPSQMSSTLTRIAVSMHLLVLSAFRLLSVTIKCQLSMTCLNAPFGAQCFPTRRKDQSVCPTSFRSVSMHLLVLSAFRLNAGETSPTFRGVSMHLLVLSAFRLRENGLIESRLILSQCTFWCSVLSDEVNRRLASRIMQAGLNAPSGAQCFPTSSRALAQAFSSQSQCTFWCSVLSDRENRAYPHCPA